MAFALALSLSTEPKKQKTEDRAKKGEVCVEGMCIRTNKYTCIRGREKESQNAFALAVFLSKEPIQKKQETKQ